MLRQSYQITRDPNERIRIKEKIKNLERINLVETRNPIINMPVKVKAGVKTHIVIDMKQKPMFKNEILNFNINHSVIEVDSEEIKSNSDATPKLAGKPNGFETIAEQPKYAFKNPQHFKVSRVIENMSQVQLKTKVNIPVPTFDPKTSKIKVATLENRIKTLKDNQQRYKLQGYSDQWAKKQAFNFMTLDSMNNLKVVGSSPKRGTRDTYYGQQFKSVYKLEERLPEIQTAQDFFPANKLNKSKSQDLKGFQSVR